MALGTFYTPVAHAFTVVRGRGSCDDAAGQLDGVRDDFAGIFVSNVYKEPGVWGWTICAGAGPSAPSVRRIESGGRCWTRTSDLVHVRHAL
jgi:hypothetical protein